MMVKPYVINVTCNIIKSLLYDFEEYIDLLAVTY